MTIPFWTPGEYELKSSRMARFRDYVGRAFGRSFENFEEFHAWSVSDVKSFWTLWFQQSGILFEGSVAPTYSPGDEFWNGMWFPNLSLNFAENLLQRLNPVPLVGIDEAGRKRTLSSADVLSQVRGLQLYLKAQGVGPGDVVAGLLPNIPEAVLAMLAATSLGAAWSSCSPDFGVEGVLDRFSQVQPKVLFLADGYFYGGKKLSLADKNAAVLAGLPSVRSTVTVPFVGGEGDYVENSKGDGKPLEFRRVPFRAPLYVMFSSGTTGKPKCIVHGVGGTLLQHAKELALHCDLKSDEKILYYTTCGWMMWNWLVSALFLGSTVYCYDGSPGFPHADSIWEWVDREKIEVFGTSAKFIASCRSAGLSPRQKFIFSRLRLVLSTGSPLLPEDFDYFYEHVSRAERPIQLASISGGTDIVSCFVLGTPLKPVLRGEIQGRGLGLDVQAFNLQGQPVIDEKAELVCVKPFPAMPVCFLNDPGNERFKKAYFERFPGVWHHGDFITIKPGGGVVIHGRSDATLNPGGVRLGTAEIYRQVETHPDVQDSLVVGQRWQGDERVVLFVKLKDGAAKLTPVLVDDLKARIRSGASPRHVPAKILLVTDIPYTRSGKKVELAVKSVIHGEMPSNLEALANPECLELFKNRPELQS
jgi:acetoacetyl-CoA synthetase